MPSPAPVFFTHQVRINMAHVDAAALIFFPRIYDLCEEALEFFFENIIGKPFKDFFSSEPHGAIVVHSEADYLKPIRLGDILTIAVCCDSIGQTSFVVKYTFTGPRGEELARAKTIHVLVNLKSHQKMRIPDSWRKALFL